MTKEKAAKIPLRYVNGPARCFMEHVGHVEIGQTVEVDEAMAERLIAGGQFEKPGAANRHELPAEDGGEGEDKKKGKK